MVDKCVVCGEYVPEGKIACLKCQSDSGIKDSGQRREFDSGAVRDMAPKGRCDLLPWSIIESDDLRKLFFNISMEKAVHHENIYCSISNCLDAFGSIAFDSYSTALLEAAFHFEDGCNKYGARNWEKGIPVDSFLDSAGRHYLKWCRGDKDERHDRAVIWNLLCALWTIKHKPELIGGE